MMRLLYEGIRDPSVLTLRKYLGVSSNVPDKYTFDDVVQEELIKFQLIHGLAVDGIVGPKTWASLRRENKRSKSQVNTHYRFNETSAIDASNIEALIQICSSLFKKTERNHRIISNTIRVIFNEPNLAKITTIGELLLFFGQTREEVGYRIRLMENANYTYSNLISLFSYYRNHKDEAKKDCMGYGHSANIANILNKVYAHRYGNGSIDSGDGLAYSGKGLNQLTFLNNYRAATASLKKVGINIDLVNKPHILANPEFCMYGALAFWGKLVHNKIKNKHIDTKTINIVTRTYNRYTQSYSKRVDHTLRLLKQIKG